MLKVVFDRYMRWRINELAYPQYAIMLDYPIRPEPRYGEGKPPHSELAALLASRDVAYKEMLSQFAQFSGNLEKITETESMNVVGEPYWDNPYFSALDAIILYSLLGSKRPSRYVEVGSGNSTKFARRAVRDLNLNTQIISIDPYPRSDVDALCDRVVRQPLEDVDLALFDELEAGDILFVDNSHRVFENSDATVFFMEVFPRLKPGVTVHIHDIFLPFDYPRVWVARHYSEQYLLAAYLLAGSNKIEVLLPLAYISQHPEIGEYVNITWGSPIFQRSFSRYRHLTGGYIGTSFWLEIK